MESRPIELQDVRVLMQSQDIGFLGPSCNGQQDSPGQRSHTLYGSQFFQQ